MVSALRSAAILTANKRKSLHHRIMLYIKGSFSLNCVLGVTWVFGLLYINSNHFFAYVFTILNASQGVMIFVFNCVLNENVWTAFISSLPATLRRRLTKRASDKGLTSGRVTSGGCSTLNKPSSSPVHHHSSLQPPPRRSRPTHQTVQLNNSHLIPLGHQHHHHDLTSLGSQTDMMELDSSRQWFPLAGDTRYSASSSLMCRSHDRSQREEEKWHYPSFNADVLSEAFTSVASLPHKPPRHTAHPPQEAVRRGSLLARVSLSDHRVSRRKDSQWSAETQISFISDGKSSRKSSLDSSYTEGHNSSSPSSSASSSPSINCPSNFLSSFEQSQRIYPSHRDLSSPHLAPTDDVQRFIHTIPECEERSPSSEKTFHFS
ncbi:hypothetical protein O3P69_008809 [Scylla paramamosain]|uniref:G-protein coupled receptors family 2 profile 2 domain-containing protein n=1 Tax=Scylla paramamosain TaxID=85552 RepID=A0AAW0TQL2_SCYPA